MPLKVLKLDAIDLIYPSGGLKLSLTTKAYIKLLSGKLASLNEQNLLETLSSGKIWISRGRACRLDFCILLDGQPVDGRKRAWLLETLGYYLCDAHVG